MKNKKFKGKIKLNSLEVEFSFIPIREAGSTVLIYQVHSIKPESLFEMIHPSTTEGYQFSFKNYPKLPNWLKNEVGILKKLNILIQENQKK